ncbi:MarR family transcriptional regulator [Agrococcus sp. ProA11]|uniref:MarR family winged helix-turn-helix transcriptional regulator n=1 Tax=Agrococcus chionoecetis TaxID=3153752 RepID=UPI0032609519
MDRDHVAIIIEQWRTERPDLDPSPIGIFGRLSRVTQRATEEIVGLYRRFDLNEGEFDILATLRRTGAPFALAPTALAEQTMVTKGAVSKRLDALASKGLVTREAADHDGRGRVVRLTDTGRSRIDDAVAAHLAQEHQMLEMLPARDRDALERILTTWALAYEARP